MHGFIDTNRFIPFNMIRQATVLIVRKAAGPISNTAVFCSAPSVICPSTVGQQAPDFLEIGFGYQVRRPQRSFAFGGFFGQDVAGA
jgi:hypothetical protein